MDAYVGTSMNYTDGTVNRRKAERTEVQLQHRITGGVAWQPGSSVCAGHGKGVAQEPGTETPWRELYK